MNQPLPAPASNLEVLRGTPHSGHVWVISKEVGKDNWQEVTRIPIIKGNEDPEVAIMQTGDPGYYRFDLLSPESKNLNRTFFKIDDKKQNDKPVSEPVRESMSKKLEKDIQDAIYVQGLIKNWKDVMPQSDEIKSLKSENRQILEIHQSEKQQMLETIKELSDRLSQHQQQVGSATVKSLEQQLQEERRKNEDERRKTELLMLEERRKLEKMSGESNTSTFQMFQLMNNQQQLYMQQQQQFFQLMLTQAQRDKEESLKLYATVFQQQNRSDRSPSALETALPGMLTAVTDLMSSSVKKILEEQEGNDVFTSRISKVQNCISSLAPVVCTNIIKLVAALKGNNGQPVATETLTQDNNVNQLLGNLQTMGIGPNEIKQIFAALPMLQGQSPAAAPIQNPPALANPPATPKAPPIPAAPLIIDVPAFEIQEPDLSSAMAITDTTAQIKE